MSNPMVRVVGSVLDLDGLTIQVGVDYDSVTIRLGGTAEKTIEAEG